LGLRNFHSAPAAAKASWWKPVSGNKMLTINISGRNAVTKPVSTSAEYAPAGSDVIYQNSGNCRSIVLKYVSLQEDK
jgi:hypothetical protein